MESKIYLRGISRTPSDRMTTDGGCAESINAFVDSNEVAPMPMPSTIAGMSNNDCRPIYIHKTIAYTNYILEYVSGNTTQLGVKVAGVFSAFMTLATGETLKEVTSTGNTLMVITDTDMHYVHYDSITSAYRYLGTVIPEPKIKVSKIAATQPSGTAYTKKRNVKITDRADLDAVSYNELKYFMANIQESEMKTWVYREHIENAFANIKTIMNKRLVSDVAEARSYNALLRPMFIRYAVRQFDGSSYVNHSAPIYIDPDDFGRDSLDTVTLSYNETNSYLFDKDWAGVFSGACLQTYSPYTLQFEIMNGSDFDGWEDIVSGIDIFGTPEFDLERWELKSVQNVEYETVNYYGYSRLNLKKLSSEEIENRICSQSSFFLIRAIDISEYKTLSGTFGIEDYEDTFGDNLAVKKRLPTDYSFSHRKVTPLTTNVFNERLIAGGARVRYYDGYPYFPSIRQMTPGFSDTIEHIKFFMRGTSGQYVVVSKDYTVTDRNQLGPWLFYPEPSCYKAEIWYHRYNRSDYYKVSVDMKEHPSLQGSYALAGFPFSGEYFGEKVSENTYNASVANTVTESNVLRQSESGNPFFFPISQTFTGSIIGVAPVTEAASTGQYGYANLYVFSTDGVKTMKINAAGEISNIDALSMDVALEGSICILNQAVAFTTERGLMLLQGSSVSCLSDKLIGKPYTLESGAGTMLTGSAWESMLSAIDSTTFMEYARTARTLYDSVNNRIVCVRTDKPYAYVYMIATESWHKCWLDGYTFTNTLNSYPQCYVSMKKNDMYHVRDFAVRTDVTSTGKTKMVIATRAFNMDRDDVRKALVDLKIRGAYNRSNVKYILLGSIDGMEFQVLHSLRGGSYKAFRIILLCDIGPNERISWIDTMFEERFGNRLR